MRLTRFPELGIAQTTQTVTGVVLIAVQSVLTGILAILLVVNAIILCCRQNPHRRRRKEAEKFTRDLDNLTPLDARNSLLKSPANLGSVISSNSEPKYPFLLGNGNAVPDRFASRPLRSFGSRSPTPLQELKLDGGIESQEGLVDGAAPLAGVPSVPPTPMERTPRIPVYAGYRGVGY